MLVCASLCCCSQLVGIKPAADNKLCPSVSAALSLSKSWKPDLSAAAATQHYGVGFRAGMQLASSRKQTCFCWWRHTYKNAVCEITAQTCESGFLLAQQMGEYSNLIFCFICDNVSAELQSLDLVSDIPHGRKYDSMVQLLSVSLGATEFWPYCGRPRRRLCKEFLLHSVLAG